MTDETSKPEKNKGGRPRKDVTKTAEFKAAVAAGVQAGVASAEASIVAKITEQFAAMRGTAAGDSASVSDQSDIQKLTASIMAMVNVNKADKPLTPQEVADRADGTARLIELLVPVQATDYNDPAAPEGPKYRVTGKTFLTDHVIEPYEVDPASKSLVPRTIEWTGIPNADLEPVNDLAKRIYAAYQQSIGGGTGREFDGSISEYMPDARPLGVTPGGIVVRGLNPSAKRTVGTLGQGSTTDVMGLRGPNDPRNKQISVLGTVAAPAVASETPKFAGQLR